MATLLRDGAIAIGILLALATPANAQAEGDAEPLLGEITITGNTRTETQVILRLIDVEPGDPFDYDTFDAVWDRLEDSGYFAFVDLDTTDRPDGTVDLAVAVEEDATLHVLPYARYSRRHKYLLGGSLRDDNLRGKGEVLDIQAVLYRIQRLRISWSKPWFLGRDGLELTAAGRIEQGPFVWRPFDYRDGEGSVRLRQSVRGPFFVEAAGGYEAFRQRDTYAWPTPDRGGDAPGTVVTAAADTRTDWLLTAAVGLDSRDNPIYPRHGFYGRFAVEHRLYGGVPDATLTSGDVRAFIDLPTKAILAARAYGRLADRPVPVERGLFWGGPETLRGASYAELEGEEGYLLTAELRYPLLLMPISPNGENVGIGLHAFFDVGDAWFDGADPGRALQSFGAGAHLNVSSWQFRFEAAKERERDWTFVFADEFTF